MYLLPFANTLNNHSLGVVLTLMAVYPLMHGTNIVSAWTRRNLFLSGLSAAMLFTLELPGLALLLGLAGMIAWVSGKRVGWYLAGASLPLIAMAVSMIAATGELIPAYAKFGGPWYEYPGSHWMKLSNPNARGIDFAKEPKWLYGFQLLFGHHGIFSLTPVWLLGGIGMVGISRRWNRTRLRDDIFGMIATLSLLISVVVIGFFHRQDEQLRRLDIGAALAILADTALAADDATVARSAVDVENGSAGGAGVCRGDGVYGALSAGESVAAPVAVSDVRILRLAALLNEINPGVRIDG